MNRMFLLLICVLLLAANWGCTQAPPPDTRAADAQAIRDFEAAWVKTAAAKDLEGWVANYADDASLLLPNAPIATGKEAIRGATKAVLGDPNFALTFASTKVDVARSGDLAYAQGNYSMTLSDPTGKPATDKGKYVTVFQKQPDGKWKVLADIINSDLPLPVPPPAKGKKK